METTVRQKYKITVDGEHFESEHQILTAAAVLRLARIDPTTHYLVAIHGHDRISYQDKPDTPIDLKEYHKFVSIQTGPTPVS